MSKEINTQITNVINKPYVKIYNEDSIDITNKQVIELKKRLIQLCEEFQLNGIICNL